MKNITRGIFKADRYGQVDCFPPKINKVNPKPELIAAVYPNEVEKIAERDANANLIAEAFNVHNETGLSPKELLEQRDYLVKALFNSLKVLKDVSKDKSLAEKQDGEDYAFQSVIENSQAILKKLKP